MKYSNSDKVMISNALQTIGVLFNKTFSMEQITIWVDNFGHENICALDVRRACVYFRSSDLEYFPPFPKWVKVAKKSGSSAEDAWTQVQHAIKMGDVWISENLNTPKGSPIKLAIDSVNGIWEIRYSDMRSPEMTKKIFIKTYNDAVSAEKIRLLGLPHCSNQQNLELKKLPTERSKDEFTEEQLAINRKGLDDIFKRLGMKYI